MVKVRLGEGKLILDLQQGETSTRSWATLLQGLSVRRSIWLHWLRPPLWLLCPLSLITTFLPHIRQGRHTHGNTGTHSDHHGTRQHSNKKKNRCLCAYCKHTLTHSYINSGKCVFLYIFFFLHKHIMDAYYNINNIQKYQLWLYADQCRPIMCIWL